MAVEQHRIAAGHQQCRDETCVALNGHVGIEELQVFALDLAFSSFDASAQVVQRDVLSVHLDSAAENEAVDLIALVADEGEGNVCPAVDGGWVLLPLRTAELKDIVIHIKRQGDVDIVRSNRRMWALRFGCLEVEEAYLIPEQGSDVTLQRRKADRRAVAEAMDANALCKTDERAYYNRCSS